MIESSEFYEISDPPESPARNQARPLLILRDVAIVWAITFAGGIVVGLIANVRGFDPSELLIAIAIGNMIAGTVAFALVGCIAPPGRWLHLRFVALFTWLTSAVNIFLIGASISDWMLSIIAIMIMMGLGGSISSILKKEPADEPSPLSAYPSRHTTPDECPMCGARTVRGATTCEECGEIFS